MSPPGRRMRLAALLLLFGLGAAPGARAECPRPEPGQEKPEQARADYLDNAPWRARVAALDQEMSATDLSRVRLLFLGDSITEAWDPAIYAAHFARYRPLNLGVRGDTTQGMLWRLPRMKLGAALRPDLIVLLIGTNNTWPGGDAVSAALGVAEVIREIRQASPRSHILLLGILPRGADAADKWRQMAGQMNRMLRSCADGKVVFYAEPGTVLVDAHATLSPTIAADYLHPTPLGYQILADALDGEIARLMK